MNLRRILKPAAALALAAAALHATTAACAAKDKERVVIMSVTEKGYEPTPITLKKGEPVLLKVTRRTDRTCATEFVLDEYKLDVPLPLGQEVAIRFTPASAGTLKYGCGMGKMISGKFVVE